MSKKTNKTSVAEALKVIADALSHDDEPVAKEETKETKKFFAVYVHQTVSPTNYQTGQYIYDEKAKEAYYQMYPQYRPKPWSLATNNLAPRYTVEIEKDDETKALVKIEKAVEGLKLINAAATAQYKDKFTYHVVKIEELTVN